MNKAFTHRPHKLSTRLGILMIVAALAAALPGVALASWSWQGTLSPVNGNGACNFSAYRNESSCSPSSTAWVQINATNRAGDTAHAGFENSSAIRGKYLNAGDAKILYEIDYFPATASVQGEMTWCAGAGGCIYGYTSVWFQVS